MVAEDIKTEGEILVLMLLGLPSAQCLTTTHKHQW